MQIIKDLKKIINSFFNPKLEVLDGEYFHEDFFKLIEFCPYENLQFLKSENKKVADFAEQHSSGNGLYTKIYQIEQNNPVSLNEKQIPFAQVDKVLIDLGLKKIEKVYSGYSTQTYLCRNTFAYKFGNAQLFVMYENEYLSEFYANNFRFHEEEEIKAKLQEILTTIGAEFNLLLNDWNLSEVIDLRNSDEIMKYLNE
jgi:hypothetical protein